MKTYPKIKDSGIESIGKIPDSWNINKLKYCFQFKKGKNAQKYTKEFVLSNVGEYPVYSGETKNSGILGKINNFEYDLDEVIFVTTVGANAMYSLVISGKFSLSQNCALIVPKNQKMNVRYYWYQLQQIFQYEKGRISLIMQPSLRFEDLKEYNLVIPSKEEQDIISCFIDKKISKIDSDIFKKQKLIELLKEKKQYLLNQAVTKGLDLSVQMKDSSKEWIGKIPKHWKLNALKKIIENDTTITYGIVQTGEHIEDGIPCLRTSDMKGKTFPKNGYIKTSPEIDAKFKRSKVHEEDIVVAIRATVGKALMVPDYLDGANLTQGTAKISPNETMNNQFVLHAINSESSQQRFKSIMKGATFKEITLEMLRNFVITCPPLKEQIEISKFINFEEKKIKLLISNIVSEIEKLQEYRQSLISSAISGKIDLRETVA